MNLRISVFNGGWNLPLWVALEQGFFANRCLNLSIDYTKNSVAMIEGFSNDTFPIVFCSADNIIAYQLNRAEVHIESQPDARIFLSGDPGFLSVVSSPTINDIADLKNYTIGVDKRDTGFAYVLYDTLARNGVSINQVQIKEMGSTDHRLTALLNGECQATLLRTPYPLMAKLKGCNSFNDCRMTTTDYQGTVGAVKASWLDQNREALMAFKDGYQEGLEWIYKNVRDAKGILANYMPALEIGLLEETFCQLTDSQYGFDRTLTPKVSGLNEVLRLRNLYSQAVSGLPPVQIDVSKIIME